MTPSLSTSVEEPPRVDSDIRPKFLVLGAGSRGHAYATAVTVATHGTIAAVAEPHDFKRNEFGRAFIWGKDGRAKDGQEFSGWKQYVEWELRRKSNYVPSRNTDGGDLNDYVPSITGVFICTLDETHVEIIHALAPLNLHILCEKPLALSLSDCLAISRSLQPAGPSVPAKKVISIGHVLRYSPHNRLLRKLVLNDRAIGDIVSVEHTEPVGWWHFSHSYVRGNWRRKTDEGIGTLLTKSCHDIDFLMWMLCSPPDPSSGVEPHTPSHISSTGHLTHFRKSRKPKEAGNATNCLACPLAEKDAKDGGCNYSALKIYRDRWLRKEKDTGWPLKIVVPEIEDLVLSGSTMGEGWTKAEEALISRLGDDYDVKTTNDSEIASRGWYGRCVYESDNNVVDTQTVTIRWDEDESAPHDTSRGPKTAVFNMTYPTKAQCDRRGRIYGTHGEIWYDSKSISVYTFADESVATHELPRQSPEEEKSHGGGDWGLARSFVNAVEAVETGKTASVREAQMNYIGADLEEIVRSHAVVFAAEEARQKNTVVDFQKWWTAKAAGRAVGNGLDN